MSVPPNHTHLCESCAGRFVLGDRVSSEPVGTCACHGGIAGAQKPAYRWRVPEGGIRWTDEERALRMRGIRC